MKKKTLRQKAAQRAKAQKKKWGVQNRVRNKVGRFWNFLLTFSSSDVQSAGFKVDKKGRPFFSIKFNKDLQGKSHVVKTACIWKDQKGNYRILMNASRTYNFKVDGMWVENTKHMSVSFLVKIQNGGYVLISQKTMIAPLSWWGMYNTYDVNQMFNDIFDCALGLTSNVRTQISSETEPF